MTKYGVIHYDAKYINKEKQRYGNCVAQIENALTALSDSEFNARNASGGKKFGDFYVATIYVYSSGWAVFNRSLALSSESPNGAL